MLKLSYWFFKRFLFSPRAGALIRKLARISIAALFVGVLALILVRNIMNGFNQSIEQRYLSVEPHVVIPINDMKSKSAAKSLATWLKAQDDMYSFSVVSEQDVVIKTADGVYGGGGAKGLSDRALTQTMIRLEAARRQNGFDGLSEVSRALQPGDVLMGVDLARSLGIFEGDPITVLPPESLLRSAGEVPRFEKMKVAALIATDIPDIDGQFIYYNRAKSFQRIGASRSLRSYVEVSLKDPYAYPGFLNRLKALGFEGSSWKDRNRSLYYALRLEKYTMSGFLGMSALITCFSIMTVMSLLMTQKRKDIGVLLAMGLSHRQVQRLFSLVGIYLSGIGILLGFGVGMALSLLLETFPLEVLPDIYYDRSIPAQVDVGVSLSILLASLVVAALMSWLPIRVQLRKTVSELLKGA